MSTELKTISPENQLSVVRATTNLIAYDGFVKEYFAAGHWLKKVHDEVTKEKIFGQFPAADDFRLLTLTGMAAGQYGFLRLDMTLGRHENHNWEASPVSLAHQTAVLLYCAKGNVDSAATKKSLIAENPELNPAIWGVNLRIREGQVDVSPRVQATLLTDARSLQREKYRTVFLPHEPLNERLATLAVELKGFDGYMADEMPEKEFRTVVFPEVKKVVNVIAGAIPIFEVA